MTDSVPTSAPVAASEQGGGDVVGVRIAVTIESDGKAPVIVWSTPVDNNLAFSLRNKSEGVSDGSDTVTISVVIGKDVFVPVWKSPFLYPSWLEELMAGLHKRSMMLLDNCGLPKWFMELVCPEAYLRSELMNNNSDTNVRASIIINIDGCEPIVLPSIAKAIQLRDALNALIGQPPQPTIDLPPQPTIDLPANPSIMPYKIARDPEWVVTYRKLE